MQGDGTSGLAIFFQLLPLLFIGGILGVIMAVVATKVGKNPVLWFLLSAIPFVNMFFLPIVLWRCVIDLHRKVEALERLIPTTLGQTIDRGEPTFSRE